MAKTRPPYAPGFRRQMVDLVRAGRDPTDLALEYEPSAQAIRNGDFPSQRVTWIKADPTWRGLQQAIKEPQKRCFIGAMPPKLQRVSSNKTFYIDEISLAKVDGSTLAESWFDGCSVPLNSDLVAVIGNKGSGKSALAGR